MNMPTRARAARSTLALAGAMLIGPGCLGEAPRPDLPIRLVERLDGTVAAAPVTFGGETRVSLVPALGTRFTVEATLPEDAVLELGAAALPSSGEILPARIEFRVELRSGDTRETIFEQQLRRFEANAWFDRDVDLSRWSGARVELAFETEALPARGSGSPAPVDAATVVPAWSSPVVFSRSEFRSARPDVILVSIDCLRSDHVGTYGYARDTTPVVDRFAEDGVVFERAVASAPETLPSHVSMLTGLTPPLHGASKRSRLPPSVPYLPEILAENGYDVSAIVTGAFLSHEFGVQRGFHRYRFLDDPGSERTVDEAIELLQHGRGRDQFLWVHLFDPHWPYLPGRELEEKFGPRPRDLSTLMAKVGNQDLAPANSWEVERIVDLYDAEIFATDRELGRFLDELKARSLYEPSLVIVVADHGEAFFEHGYWQHTFTLYEEMIRIPLVVKWPNGALRGRSSAMAHQVDVFATILEAAGISAPENEGRSLASLFTTPGEEPRALVSEAGWTVAGRHHRLLSHRDPELKYILAMEGDASRGWPPADVRGEEIYSLRVDAGERDDLSDEVTLDAYRSILRAYSRRIEAFRAETPDAPHEIDGATLERLRALGYVE